MPRGPGQKKEKKVGFLSFRICDRTRAYLQDQATLHKRSLTSEIEHRLKLSLAQEKLYAPWRE